MVGQTFPQPLQLLTLLVVLISQPFAVLPSQLAYPALQRIEQSPALQEGVPLAVPHVKPQDPQFATSAPVFVSHPFA